MPGIEARAPDRTETRSGAEALPNEVPTIAPIRCKLALISACSSGVSYALNAAHMAH